MTELKLDQVEEEVEMLAEVLCDEDLGSRDERAKGCGGCWQTPPCR